MRTFRTLLLVAAILIFGTAHAQSIDAEILVRSVLAAGLRHHEAKAVWHRMAVGDALTLVREPGNGADPNAVRIDWQGHVLGYLPRQENAAIARQLDRGAALAARIRELTRYRNHRLKLGIDVYMRL